MDIIRITLGVLWSLAVFGGFIYAFSEWYLKEKERLPELAKRSGLVGETRFIPDVVSFYLPERLEVTKLSTGLELLFILTFWLGLYVAKTPAYIAIGIEIFIYASVFIIECILKRRYDKKEFNAYLIILIVIGFLFSAFISGILALLVKYLIEVW